MKKRKKSGSASNRERSRALRKRSDRLRKGEAAQQKGRHERQSGGLDKQRIDAMNAAMEMSHDSLRDIETEFLEIQEGLSEMDRADMACIQASMLVGYAQEYTRSVLSS